MPIDPFAMPECQLEARTQFEQLEVQTEISADAAHVPISVSLGRTVVASERTLRGGPSPRTP
jgi:hypothetical protein